jgi:hypothetical protein
VAAHPRNQASRQQLTEPASPSPFGTAAVVIGVLLVLAGPVVLGVAILPHVLPTFGPEPLTVRPRPASSLPEDGGTWSLYLGTLLLPAAGFSTAYLSARHRLRRWIAGACVVLFALQTVLLAAALLWVTGSGLPASAILDADRDSSTAIVTAPLALLFCLAAAAIMYVLAGRTDFDAKSAEYFARGDAVVRVRPLPLRFHALWLLVALAVWAALVWLPVIAVGRIQSLGLDELVGGPEPWPVSVSDDFAIARAAYAVVIGIVAGGILSSLAKKALYRSPLGASLQRPVDDRTADRWRGLQPTTHYPIALAGGTLTACALFLVPSDRHPYGVSEPDTTAIAIFASISVALVVLGGVLVASAWKTGDDPLHDAPLQRARPYDLQGSFARPARRTRAKRPSRSKKRR